MKIENWTVWVGGVEINDYCLSESEAKAIAEQWQAAGYDDAIAEKIGE